MELLYQIADVIFTGYPFAIFLIVILKLFIRNREQQSIIESANLTLLFGSIVNLVATIYFFISNQEYAEPFALINRMFGPYWFDYWGRIIVTVWLPLLFIIKKIRKRLRFSILLAVFIPAQEYLIRFALIFLHSDFLPSTWAMSFLDYRITILQIIFYLAILAAFHWSREKIRRSKFFHPNS